MRHLKLGSLAVAAGLLLLGPGSVRNAAAQDMHHDRGMMMGHDQLTPEQQTKAHQIFQQNGPAMMQLRQMIMGKRLELSAITMGQNPDEKQVQSLIKEIAGLDEKLLQTETNMRRQLSAAGIPPPPEMGHGMMGEPHMGMMGGSHGAGSCPCGAGDHAPDGG